jgi:hypothetical protein
MLDINCMWKEEECPHEKYAKLNVDLKQIEQLTEMERLVEEEYLRIQEGDCGLLRVLK